MRFTTTLFSLIPMVIFFLLLESNMPHALHSPLLSAILEHIVITGPNSSNRKNGGVIQLPGKWKVAFRDSSCFHFDVDDIDTTTKQSTIEENVESLVTSLTVSGLRMQCKADLYVEIPALLVRSKTPYKGNFTIAFATSTAGEEKDAGLWKTNVKFESFDFQNQLPFSTSLDYCESNLNVLAKDVKLTPESGGTLPAWFFGEVESFIQAFAPYLGPLVVDPLLCDVAKVSTESLNVLLRFYATQMEPFLGKFHSFPNLKHLERKVRPKYKNSSLPLTPYVDSKIVSLVTHLINDLMGVPVKKHREATTNINNNNKKKELVINKFIKHLLNTGKNEDAEIHVKDWDDVLNIPFGKDDDGGGASLLRLNLVEGRIGKLNVFSVFELLLAIGEYTFRHSLEFNDDVHFFFTWEVELVIKQEKTDVVLEKSKFDVSFSLSNFKVQIFTLLAMDQSSMLDFDFGSENLLACFLSLFAALEIPEVNLFNTNVLDFRLSTYKKTDENFPIILGQLLDGFLTKPFLVGGVKQFKEQFPFFLAWVISPLLTQITRNTKCKVGKNKQRTPELDPNRDSSFVQFPNNGVVDFVKVLINQVIGVVDEDYSINRIMEIVTNQLSSERLKKKRMNDGYLLLHETLTLGPHNLSHMFPTLGVGNSAMMEIGNVTIGPLNVFQEMDLFHTNSSRVFELDNYFRLKDALKVQLDIHLKLVGMTRSNVPFNDRFQLSVLLKDPIEIVANVLLKVSLHYFNTLQVKDLFSSCVTCLLSPVDAFVLSFMGLAFDEIKMDFLIYEATSPKLSPLFTSISENSDQVKALLINHLIPRVSGVFNGSYDSYFDGLTVRKGVNHLVQSGYDKCVGNENRHPHAKPPTKPKWIPPMKWVMGISAGLMVVSFVLQMVLIQRRHRQERSNQTERLLGSPLLTRIATSDRESITTSNSNNNNNNSGSTPLARLITGSGDLSDQETMEIFDNHEEKDLLYLLGLSKALLFHPRIDRTFRVGVFLMLVLNFSIFVAGNFFTMGSIRIFATLLGEEFKDIPMLTLTLDTCIDMMVEGRAILFAFFIAGSSGILPWIRVAVLLVCWLVPPTILTPVDRGVWLNRMQALSKWCLAEVYLFTILQTMINVTMQNPSTVEFIPKETVLAYIECSPEWGLFVFLVGVWISLVLNHACIFFHNQVVEFDSSEIKKKKSGTTSLEEEGEKKRTTVKENIQNAHVQLALSVCLVVWPIISVCSLFVDVLTVKFLGFSGFGMAMMSSTGTTENTGSLVSVLFSLKNSDPAHYMNSFGLFLMVVGYFLFIILSPVLTLICCEVLYFYPLTQKQNAQLSKALTVAFSWSAMEVFLCTILVIVLQIHKFFASMSGMLTFLPVEIGYVLSDFGASFEEAVSFGVKASLEVTGFIFVLMNSLLTIGCYLAIKKYNHNN